MYITSERRLKTRRKLLLVAFALIVVALSVGLWQLYESSKTPEMKAIPVPLLGSEEIKNPEIAKQYGIVGYIEYNATADAPRTLAVAKGEKASIMILIHFVSHDPKVTEARINIDPNSGRGLVIEQCYVITDESGEIVGEGVIYINKHVSYNVSGVVEIRAGETLPVTLTIRIPMDFPSGVDPFLLGAVGIEVLSPSKGTAELDNIRVMVHA